MSYSLLRGLCVEARDEYANHSECLFKIQNNIKKELQEKKSSYTFIEADARLYCSAEFLINRWCDAMPMRVYNSERLPEEKWSTLICIIFFCGL